MHGDASETAAAALEIRALRKGRGLQSADLVERMGDRLRELAGGAPGGTPHDSARIRAALTDALTRLAGGLDRQMRDAVLGSLAIHPATRELTTFTERKTWVAEKVFDRGDRQAERKIGEAELLLAEKVAIELATMRGQPAAASDGWYVKKFTATYLLYGEAPIAVERRRIVATRDGLGEIFIPMDVPRDGEQRPLPLRVEVTDGGHEAGVEQPAPGRFRFRIRLSETLDRNQEHEYEIVLRVAPGEQVRPYYVYTPARPCQEFELKVRFDSRRLPAWVRLVDAEGVRDYERVAPREPFVIPDATGEATARFRALRQQYGYGLQWSFDPDCGPSPSRAAV